MRFTLFSIFSFTVLRLFSASPLSSNSVVDTLTINISQIVFLTNDTLFNCYYIENDHVFLVDEDILKNYIEYESRPKLSSTENKCVKEFNLNSIKDTINSINKTHESYLENSKYVVDEIGIPILWYDLQAAYLFNLFEESYSNKYIYLVDISRVGRTDFKYFDDWFYTLYKVDLFQDSASNFYFHTKSSSWKNDSIQMDSTILSKKKLSRINKKINLLSIYEGELPLVYDTDQIHLLYFNNVRYIPNTYFPPLNSEGSYSIGRIINYARKSFKAPYFEKK